MDADGGILLLGLPVLVWVNCTDLWRRDKGCENLEIKVLHVPDAVRAALNHPYLVVESLHEAEGHFVIRTTVTDDALPMALDHFGELLVRFEATLLELLFPVLEELLGPSGILIIPELPEGFFEHIGFAQALVGLEQQSQGAPAVHVEIGFMRQKRIALPFDETLILGGYPGVFPASNLVEGVRQVLEDMELVKDNFGLWSVALQRVPERLPHVHDRQAQGAVPPGSHSVEEPVHILFGTTQLLAHPYRPLLIQVGDHNGVTLALADRDFIDADGSQALLGQVVRPEFPHIANVHTPDLVPTKPVERGDLLDGHRPTEPTNRLLESLGEASRFGQPRQGLLLHTSALAAVHPAIFEFRVNPGVPGIDITHTMGLAVIEDARDLAA